MNFPRHADMMGNSRGNPAFRTRVRHAILPDATTKSGTRLVGDVAFAEVQPKAGLITPNPGGVGPRTIAMLLANTARAAENFLGAR